MRRALVQKTGPYGAYVDCVNREKEHMRLPRRRPGRHRLPGRTGHRPTRGEADAKRGKFYGCWNYPNCSYTTNSLEREDRLGPRRSPEREDANKKLLERSARGKAAFAKRKTNASTSVGRARPASWCWSGRERGGSTVTVSTRSPRPSGSACPSPQSRP